MKLKKFALRGLIALAVLVAMCMFFSRTVQTITTPKVQLITAEKGRFEEKLSYSAQVYFAETEAITADTPHGTKVSKTHVQPGDYVQPGDVIFTLYLPGYDAQKSALQTEHLALATQLMELDIANHGLPRVAPQQNLYDAMADANAALHAALYAAKLSALQSGAAPSEPEAVVSARLAYDEACAAYIAYTAAHPGSEAILTYVNARNALLSDMEALTTQMLSLDMAVAQSSTVIAPHSGYIVQVDADTLSYTLSSAGCDPILRCSAPGRTIAEGARADVSTELFGTERTAVLGMSGSFLHIAVPEGMTIALHTLIETGAQVNITHRAKQASTLLPISALRGSGEDTYVYQIEYVYGGILSTRSMQVVKVPVTVIERSSKTVSIVEDLENAQLAVREDRPLTDGQIVMEYVN